MKRRGYWKNRLTRNNTDERVYTYTTGCWVGINSVSEMEIKAKEITIVPIEKIIPSPKNPNKHPKEQIERLSKIVDFQGFRVPLIVSKRSGFLVSGHGRLEMAKLSGVKELPVMYQDFESEAQEYAFVVSDNEIARWAETDLSMVNLEMLDLGPEFDIELFGINNFTIEPLEKFEMEDELKEDMNKKFMIEITFPNDMEMMDIHDDLVSRGYIVKIK